MIKHTTIFIDGIPYDLKLDCSMYPPINGHPQTIAKIHSASIRDDAGKWQPFPHLAVLFNELEQE